MKKKLLFIVNEPTYFISHRFPIALAAHDAGYEIHLATGTKAPPPEIREKRFYYHHIPLSRSGQNIFLESLSVVTMYRLMKQIQPDIVHLITTKPVIYGSFVARLARVPAVVAAVSGLGFIFTGQDFKTKSLRRIVHHFYQFGFKHKNLKVIFQNKHDQALLLEMGVLQAKQSLIIHGSGVDLSQYAYAEEPSTRPLIVLMAARLLADKGIREYVEAARILKLRGMNVEFWLAGSIDPGNPTSVNEEQLQTWQQEGSVKILSYIRDIPKLFSQVHLVVLPSYREGLPRVLSEAAACGRAVITSDVPGCRDAILPEKTGMLVKVKDALDLANAIQYLLSNDALRKEMGLAARYFAERRFDITRIVKAHMDIFSELDRIPFHKPPHKYPN